MTRLGVFQITKQFKTPVKGVTGYLLNQHGRYSVVYGIDGYVLAGALLSPTGANLTAAYNHQYAPKPAYAGIIKALRKDGNLISMGSPTAKQVLYVFEDPNCIFCHKLSVALTPYLKAGKVRIEIAPVAFVHPDSMGKSTAILAAKDPGAAWAENEDAAKYNTHTEEGGYAVQNPPDPKLVAVVRRNMRLMGKAGFGGTPGILYRGADGKWAGAAGFPGVAWLVRQFGKP
jgi:thiol:disulfide interchange protein DsbG